MSAGTGLHARSASARLAAVQAAASEPNVNIPVLLEALSDKANIVVAAAVGGLAKCEPTTAIPALIDCYWRHTNDPVKHDAGCLVRIAIVKALAKWKAGEATPVFFHAISTIQSERVGDTAVALRVQAAVALAELRPPGALLALSLLLFEVEPQVPYALEDRLYVTMVARQTAARALAALGEAGGVAALGVKLAHDEDEIAEVLVECIDALAILDADASIVLLPRYLRHRNSYLVAAAATALAGLPSSYHQLVVEHLVTACADGTKEAQQAIALAIAAMRSDLAVPALVQLAVDTKNTVRQAAREGLEQRGDTAALNALRQLDNDRYHLVD